MKNSILKSLLSLKNQFGDVSGDSYAFVNKVLDADFSQDITKTWVTNAGEIVNLASRVGSDDLTIDIVNSVTQQGGGITLSKQLLTANNAANALQIYDGTVLGNYTVSDLIGECGASAQRYESFAKLTDMFAKSQTVDVNVLLNQIDGMSLPGLDTSSLKNDIVSMSRNEKLSQIGWIQILNGYFGEAKKTTDEGGVLMDSSSVYYVSNVLGMVINGIFNILATVAALVGAVIGGIFTVIGVILNLVFNVIGQIIPQVADTHMRISDALSSTNYIDGPIIKNWFNLPSSLGLYGAEATVYSMGGSDHYVFNDKINGKTGINAFLSLDIDANACFAEWRNRWSVTNGAVITITPNEGIQYGSPYESILSLENQVKIRSESIDEIEERTIAAAALYGLSLLDTSYIHKVQRDNFSQYSAADWAPYGDIKVYARSWPVRLGLVMLYYYLTNPNFEVYSWAHQYLLNQTIDPCTQWIINNSSGVGIQDDGITAADPLYVCTLYTDTGDLTLTVHYRFVPFSVGRLSGRYSMPYIVGHTDEVDFIPEDRCFSMNSATLAQILLASTVVAVVMVGVIVAGTILKKKISQWKFNKQIQSTQDLAAAKSNYVDDPSTDTLKEYYKATKKYNRKAKLLGWPTYDPVNSWYDYSSQGGSSNSSIEMDDLFTLIRG